MTPLTWTPTICPQCDRDLPGIGPYCAECAEYVDRMGATTDTPPSRREAVADTRTEAEIQLAIRRTAEVLGYEVYDLSQSRPTQQTPGLPDLYIRGKGRRLWCEVKRPKGGKLSDAQRHFGNMELAHGGEWITARSEQDFIEWHQEAR